MSKLNIVGFCRLLLQQKIVNKSSFNLQQQVVYKDHQTLARQLSN